MRLDHFFREVDPRSGRCRPPDRPPERSLATRRASDRAAQKLRVYISITYLSVRSLQADCLLSDLFEIRSRIRPSISESDADHSMTRALRGTCEIFGKRTVTAAAVNRTNKQDPGGIFLADGSKLQSFCFSFFLKPGSGRPKDVPTVRSLSLKSRDRSRAQLQFASGVTLCGARDRAKRM